MESNNSNCPPDFNLFLAAGAVQGALEAILEMTAEVPAGEAEFNRWFDSLSGLAWNGRRAAREIHDFLGKASDAHRFPANYAQLDQESDCACDLEELPPRRHVRHR